MPFRRIGVGALLTSLALLVGVGCAGDDRASVTSAPPPATTGAATVPGSTVPGSSEPGSTEPAGPNVLLEDWRCPESVPAGAECHRVTVPADWSEPDPVENVSLPVVVLKARGVAQPDPIVVPAGGPGFEGLGGAKFWSTSPLNYDRDIILYDQRGTGLAEPGLECPERDDVWVANLRQAEGFDVERAAVVEALLACRDRLEEAGVDLGHYDTEANVSDLDAIRRVLGYDQWNLLGVSYGSRLSLAAMRSTPESIRSVVLDSVYDVTSGGMAATVDSGNRAVGALVAACAADTTCNEAHPDLGVMLNSLRERYNATPAEVLVDLGDGTGPQPFVVTGDDVMAGVFQGLYDASVIPVLPAIIDAASAGDVSLIPEFVRRGVPFGTGQADAMALAVDCADNAGLDLGPDAGVVADPGPWTLLAANVLCAEWPVPPTSPTFNDPIVSDIPALVLAGAFDPVTPPDGTQAVARRLPNATFVRFANQGHGVTGDPCADRIVRAFLADPTAPIDTSCVDAIGAPLFA